MMMRPNDAPPEEKLLLRTQSKRASITEALASTLVGFGIALAMQYVLWAAYDIKATASQTINVTLWMTLVSVIRGYVLRRLWNTEWWKHFKRKKIDMPAPEIRNAHRLGIEMANMSHAQKSEINPRLLKSLDNELGRVLRGGKLK